MALTKVNWRMKDSREGTKYGVISAYFESTATIANLQQWSDLFVPIIESVSGAFVIAVDTKVEFTNTASNGVNAETPCDNERGGLIQFSTDGEKPESVRIPAILSTIMNGSAFNPEANPVDDFSNAYIVGLTPALGLLRPRTSNGDLFTGALAGVESFRK